MIDEGIPVSLEFIDRGIALLFKLIDRVGFIPFQQDRKLAHADVIGILDVLDQRKEFVTEGHVEEDPDNVAPEVANEGVVRRPVVFDIGEERDSRILIIIQLIAMEPIAVLTGGPEIMEVGGKEDEGDSLGEVDDWLVTGEQAKNNEDKRNNGAIFLRLILSVASELPSYCMGANCKEKEAID